MRFQIVFSRACRIPLRVAAFDEAEPRKIGNEAGVRVFSGFADESGQQRPTFGRHARQSHMDILSESDRRSPRLTAGATEAAHFSLQLIIERGSTGSADAYQGVASCRSARNVPRRNTVWIVCSGSSQRWSHTRSLDEG